MLLIWQVARLGRSHRYEALLGASQTLFLDGSSRHGPALRRRPSRTPIFFRVELGRARSMDSAFAIGGDQAVVAVAGTPAPPGGTCSVAAISVTAVSAAAPRAVTRARAEELLWRRVEVAAGQAVQVQ